MCNFFRNIVSIKLYEVLEETEIENYSKGH